MKVRLFRVVRVDGQCNGRRFASSSETKDKLLEMIGVRNKRISVLKETRRDSATAGERREVARKVTISSLQEEDARRRKSTFSASRQLFGLSFEERGTVVRDLSRGRYRLRQQKQVTSVEPDFKVKTFPTLVASDKKISKETIQPSRMDGKVTKTVKTSRVDGEVAEIVEPSEMSGTSAGLADEEDRLVASEKLTRAERRERAVQNARAAHDNPDAIKIIFHVGVWYKSKDQTRRVLRSIATQILQLRMFNISCIEPAAVTVCGIKDDVKAELERIGSEFWTDVVVSEKPLEDFLPNSKPIVLMSPDAHEPLLGILPGTTFIISAIVDKELEPELSLKEAKLFKISARRLPISEAFYGLPRTVRIGPKVRPILYNLNMNIAAASIIQANLSRDWRSAFVKTISHRELRKNNLMQRFDTAEREHVTMHKQPSKKLFKHTVQLTPPNTTTSV